MGVAILETPRLVEPDRRTLALADGVVDLAAGCVTRGGRTSPLWPIEVRLLEFLAARPGQSFDAETLQVHVWGYRPGIASRTVRTTVWRLRLKLEVDPATPRHLLTRRGGYAFEPTRSTPGATPVDPLVGRNRELDTVETLLSSARLVTVVGPGGVGKSALARQVVAAPRFAVAVFVQLEAASSADDVPARALEALARPGRDWDTLADALRASEALLVLDGVEQIRDLAPPLAALLAAVPTARVLATSRAPIRARCEALVRLRGLAPADAEALFVRCAGLASPGARPAPDAVARIAAEVDGLPLALVLAAAWLRALSADEVLDELGRGLDVLAEEPSEADARHPGVRAALDRSWRLLSASDQDHLRRVARFDGAFTAGEAGVGLLDLVRLVDASLVDRPDAERFIVPRLVRRYVRDRAEDRTGGRRVG